ncbi:metallophosphoesterase [Nocardioides sp.]|uniref:metallophosphoesterase family protein n=1 Tax=Nocardioides sp. TaxID=35761 RepID=UPI00271C57EC|nr:metallophosphoesterase family protein [Nocardioides sp.]MDO9456925.1 metallophosphoesterase family protein [Nocardioides sp.]
MNPAADSVAVLSDVHGVLPVLEAVLAEPDVRSADVVVVCGDHAAGPQPVEVLDLLASRPDVVLVRGNADRDLLALGRGEQLAAGEPHEVDAWAAAQLSEHHLRLLAQMPHPVTLDVRGFGPVVFCHGTPRDDDEVVLVDTRLEKWAEAFAGLPDEVRTVVCGHTHMPFVRLVDRRVVVNPGSIGMPYGRPGGHWALLRDGDVSLRRVEVDVDDAVRRVVAGSSYPGRQAWADTYVRATASDKDALEAFGPRDGRS